MRIDGGCSARSERFRVQRAREVLNSVHQPRRGAIYGIAYDNNMTMLHRFEFSPAGAGAQRVDLALRVSSVRAGEHQNFRLNSNNFFEADARPFVLGFQDGAPARAAQCVRDKSVAANRN
jgi:hypothetical protein